jgi:GMP synthase-like glutamine amidotransferase
MGGPQSVYDPSLQNYFKPFLDLVKDVVQTPNTKILGICLGSQIIAKALGSQVFPGKNGPELGFGQCKIEKPSHPVFTNIHSNKIDVFHWHEDTYEIPSGAEWLSSSDKYPSQFFSYKNKAFGIQCHIEITNSILSIWKTKSSEIKSLLNISSEELNSKIQSVQHTGKQIIENIINL